MLDINTKLNVKHYNNGTTTYTDFSTESFDYARDHFSLALTASVDYLYVGYDKPINSTFIEMKAINTAATTLTVEFWNGSAWVAVEGKHDDTKGFTRSGFIQWNRNQTAEAQKTINTKLANWYRISSSATLTGSPQVWGINLVFSDDQLLKEEFAGVLSSRFLPSGQTSHILTHVAVRNEIIQRMRNKDNYVKSSQTSLTQWDLLEISEVKQAAKYFALSKIFLNVSDAADDSYAQKSALYASWAVENINLARASLDFDDDGVTDSSEKIAVFNTRRITR